MSGVGDALSELARAANEPLRSSRCQVKRMLDTMTLEQAAEFETFLASRLSGEKIAAVMTKAGFPIAGQAVNNCRAGSDACRKPRR